MKEKSILIVDDDEAILTSLETILNLEGFTVETARTGREALDILNTKSFRLGLINLRLPDMNGTELLTMMDPKDSEMVKIVLTGAPRDIALEAMKYGAEEYLIKPIEPARLLEVLGEKLSENQGNDATGER